MRNQSINQLNMDNDSEDVTSSGRSFQVRGTGRQTGVRLATVVNLTGSTIRRLHYSRQNGEFGDQESRRRSSVSSQERTATERLKMIRKQCSKAQLSGVSCRHVYKSLT